MTTVDNTRVVNHVGLGSEAVKGQDTDHELEAALEREEEAAMDEEIHSDDEDPMRDTIEKQMLTVALVKSVVDSGKKPESTPREAETSNAATRYGLRKRRRPGDSSPETETIADSTANMTNTSSPAQDSPRTRRRRLKADSEQASKLPAIEKVSEDKPQSSNEVDVPLAKAKAEGPPARIKTEESSKKVEDAGSENTEPITKPPEETASGNEGVDAAAKECSTTKVIPGPAVASAVNDMAAPSSTPKTSTSSLPVNLNSTVKENDSQLQDMPAPSTVSVTKPDVVDPTTVVPPLSNEKLPKAKTTSPSVKPAPKKASPKPRAKPQKPRQKSTKTGGKKKVTLPPVSTQMKLIPTSGAVPNPLSTPIDTGSSLLMPPPALHDAAEAPTSMSTSVPCPLQTSVPCPLPPVSFQEKAADAPPPDRKVTINEPPVMSRSRVFSVDLDPSTFDFPEFKGGETDTDKVPEVDPANAVDVAVLQRERAYSFEFFNFTGDELLPAAPDTDPSSMDDCHSDHLSMRPRGDSIIFDPVSFQDGGIHEKNALMKARATSIGSAAEGLLLDNKYTPVNNGVASHQTPVPETNVSSASAPTDIVPSADSTSGEMATLPSALSTNTANGASPATFQLELLNKDGRIGIYLPEARKARIARFHAKRKMRIWRKRIKYDCRKKLADSRPRIKGRFVKRSDVDD